MLGIPCHTWRLFLIVRERQFPSPTQKVVGKSSICTNCDDGDDDACNLQQEQQDQL